MICVTARGEIEDRVRGLNGGAEDYIVKPFAVEELVARIQAALRRRHKEQTYYRLGSVEVRGSGAGRGQKRRDTGGADNQGI